MNFDFRFDYESGGTQEWFPDSLEIEHVQKGEMLFSKCKARFERFAGAAEGYAKYFVAFPKFKIAKVTELKSGKIIHKIELGKATCNPCCGIPGYAIMKTFISKEVKVENPRMEWDGKTQFLDYRKEFYGHLSYEEFCESAGEDNTFLFNDYTHCSERMWDGLIKIHGH